MIDKSYHQEVDRITAEFKKSQDDLKAAIAAACTAAKVDCEKTPLDVTKMEFVKPQPAPVQSVKPNAPKQ